MRLRVQGRVARGSFSLDADVDLELEGVAALVGASGAGKSTVLRLIAGFEPEADACVEVDGERWQGGGRALPPHRRAVGTVFQESRLFPHLTARGNLAFAERAGGSGRKGRSGARLAFGEVVDFLDLQPLLDLRPQQLSGGQRQRVALGRTLLSPARLWLFDEPMSALDAPSRREIAPYLTALCRRHAVPILYVSHALPEVLRIADAFLLAAEGRVSVADSPAAFGAAFDDAEDGDAGAVIACVFAHYDARYRLSALDFEGVRIHVPGDLSAAPGTILLHIPARDVSISTAPVEHLSILNRVDGVIDALDADASTDASADAVLVRVRRGGQTLLARITRRSADELGLRVGMRVQALVKSAAVRAGDG